MQNLKKIFLKQQKKLLLCDMKLEGVGIYKGSYTVEAALVMPLVLGIVFIILGLTFYLHDYNILYEYTNRMAQKYILERQHTNEEISQTLSEELNDDMLMITENASFDVRVKKGSIKIECNADINKPQTANILFWNKKNYVNISMKKTAKRINQVDFIRKCRRIDSEN